MTNEEYNKIIAEIETLPTGGITYKKINGKEYAYYQWREDGKQHTRRTKDEELEQLSKQIERRKVLQNLIKNIDNQEINEEKPVSQFRCTVRIGEELERFVKPVAKWVKRECYQQLHDYVYGDIHDRVYILYGLRRTGKTTLIRQLISEMDTSMRSKTVFIQIQDNKTLDDVNRDLKVLEEKGYRYVFIDEVTLMNDFIEGAALFSDVFAASGMKIVLSGTDSLGFMFTEDEELYDRCIMCHTTFIPYREFERVLGIVGIDDFIRYGGTMSLGGKQYNDNAMIFATKKSTDEYVDSAIARNIQHSLKNYKYEGHFRSFRDLYEKNELTNAINRIVEDMNHRFTMEVLTRDFKSNDLRISASNLRKDREEPTDILDRIDILKVNEMLKSLLEIKDKEEQKVEIQDSHRYEIKEYLDLLDLTVEIESRWMSDYNRRESRTAFSQPGMRYSQAEALIKSLMQDDMFRGLSFEERKRVTERIIDEIKGRMMEDIVLLETKLSKKNCEVFRLQFAIGEFDMVVFNPDEGTCEIYEIKHSKEVVPQQCKHLLDEQKCKDTEFRYGTITGKYVIYRGATTSLVKAGVETQEDVAYLNVEEYLKAL
ncbi:AAA family ATPase [Roseburia sp. MSJ-14]|uniref:AAA family ATPase n=1 Tax=Roseburia sp. MSJ-14 TaxID=2841514 RepID=UPI001C0F8B41|nr:AAA family ATPase [Roseburia sp. MSJ-14]MBU5473050.1 AAA family ATPase [Roseburia sp. MSJ-14]